MFSMPGADVPDTLSEMYSATPYAWDTRAMVSIQTKNWMSTVSSCNTVNANTDAGVQHQEIEDHLQDETQPVQISASLASAAFPTPHGEKRETVSHAGAERSGILDVEADTSTLDAAGNDDEAGTAPDNAGLAVVNRKDFQCTNYHMFVINAYARQMQSTKYHQRDINTALKENVNQLLRLQCDRYQYGRITITPDSVEDPYKTKRSVFVFPRRARVPSRDWSPSGTEFA